MKVRIKLTHAKKTSEIWFPIGAEKSKDMCVYLILICEEENELWFLFVILLLLHLMKIPHYLFREKQTKKQKTRRKHCWHFRNLLIYVYMEIAYKISERSSCC